MKLNCGLSKVDRQLAWREANRSRYCKWHRWFAWRPIRVGKTDCRWLEWVERKADRVSWFAPYNPRDFSYRAMAQ